MVSHLSSMAQVPLIVVIGQFIELSGDPCFLRLVCPLAGFLDGSAGFVWWKPRVSYFALPGGSAGAWCLWVVALYVSSQHRLLFE